jgi:AraC family transcriptional regulator
MHSSRPSVVRTPGELLNSYLRSPLLRSHPPTQWKNIGLSHLRQPPYAIPEVCLPSHILVIFPNAASINSTIDGTTRQQTIVPGDIMIIPANVGQGGSWIDELEMVTIALPPSLFAEAIDDDTKFRSTELVPHFATPDPLVHQLGLSLKTVLEQNSGGSRLYAETTAAMLSVHLLQHYSQRKPEFKDYADGLPRATLRQVIEYIHAHLDQELGLAELAAIAHLSPYYFTRLFKQSTGVTPHQFVIRCRVEQAKALLLAGKGSIAEIAQQVGFANQAHLNVHIKRLLGVTPKTILEQRKNQ